MTELLTAAQMRAIEQAAIKSGQVTGLELMERAGHGVVEAVFEEWPDLAPVAAGEHEYLEKDERRGARRAVVLCGPGNNGGDGFVVARLFHARGWAVEVFFYGEVEKLPPDARVNYQRWADVGAVQTLSFPIAAAQEVAAFAQAASHIPDLRAGHDLTPKPPFVVIDALFGIGLRRPLTGLDGVLEHWDYLANFRDLNAARLVAVDVPSGLDADTGTVLRGESTFSCLAADLTVTFHRFKRGHLSGEGATYCGKPVVKDIGL